MRNILLLLAIVTALSGCIYVPFDARADYPNVGRGGHDRGGHGDRDGGERRRHDD